MLAFDNYTDLTAAIADWMDRGDLTGSVQSMIALAESRMRRKLNPLFNETSASVAVDASGIGSLPSDCGEVQRVVYDTNTLPRWSGFSVSSLAESTIPTAYTLDAAALRLWPACAVTVTVWYQPVLPQLSAAAPTNDLLSKHPDLYFFGAMMFAEGYVSNDNRAGTFKALFDEGLEEVATYLMAQKYTGPLHPKIARQA